MSSVIRTIGNCSILVEVDKPFDISLEESIIEDFNLASNNMTKKELLSILSNNNGYIPLTLHWEIIDKCNLSCPFCYIVGHSNKKMVRFHDMQGELDAFIEKGLLFCTMTGGEATLHPDYIEIYSYLKQKGVIVEIYTNGLNLTENHINTYYKYPPSVIEISLYTLNDERMKKVYGSKQNNAATQILNNVLRLKKEGFNIECKTFINTETKNDLESIQKWCKLHSIEYSYSDKIIKEAYDGDSLESFGVNNQVADEIPTNNNLEITCLPCNAKKYGSALDTSLSVSPCPSIRHNEFYFNLMELGTDNAFSRLMDMIDTFKDQTIKGSCASGDSCASCVAFAIPEKNEEGEIVFFKNK